MFEQIVKDKANVYFLVGIMVIYFLLFLLANILGFFFIKMDMSLMGMFMVLMLLFQFILYLMTFDGKGFAQVALILALIGAFSGIIALKTDILWLRDLSSFTYLGYIMFSFLLMRVKTTPGRMMSWGLLIYSFFFLCEPTFSASLLGLPPYDLTGYVFNIILSTLLQILPLLCVTIGVILHLLSFTKNKEIPVQE